MNKNMNIDMNIEEEFPSLRVQFGPDGRADQLTFSQFLALPENKVEMLLARVEDFVAAGRLAEMRLIAKFSAQGKALPVLHHYHCRLLHARHLKCFRASVFKVAEENLAFVRKDFDDGIKCDSFDLEIDLVFEERSWMLRFQSALLRIAGDTTSNKKPKFAAELKTSGESDEDEGDDEEQNSEFNFDIEIQGQVLSLVPLVDTVRVFYHEYLHNSVPDGAANSPLSGSMSICEPETVTMSIERVGQMIENPHHIFFHQKNPEISLIKDKGKNENRDENNYLYLSRFLLEAFHGINAPPTGCPRFLIRYVSHQESSMDYVALQKELFGNNEDFIVYDRTKRYHRTVVQIEFADPVQANIYSSFLRDGCRRVDPNDPLRFEMDLYFSDPVKAKKYFDWKEKETRRQWDR